MRPSSPRTRTNVYIVSLLSVACSMHCTTDRPREHYGRPGSALGTKPDAGATSGGGAGDATRDAAAAAEADASTYDPVPEHCGEPPQTAGEFSREALRSASADCAVWHYCAFQSHAVRLVSAVEAYAQDRSTSQRSVAHTRAREAYRQAMRAWSRAELFQFGPAASSAEIAGKDTYQGKGLRDRIYAWPATARCRVEEEILRQTSDFSRVLLSGRGLFALEYALFYEASDTACAATTRTAAEWAQLSPEQIEERKAAYAVAVANDIRSQVDALLAAWSSDGGDFRQVFVSASGYPNEQEALNVLGFALI